MPKVTLGTRSRSKVLGVKIELVVARIVVTSWSVIPNTTFCGGIEQKSGSAPRRGPNYTHLGRRRSNHPIRQKGIKDEEVLRMRV